MSTVDGDPELRMALIEWQTQRIRELERSQRQASPVAYLLPEETFSPDGSGGQAGDDAAFSQALSDLAWKANNAGTDLSIPIPPDA